MKILRTRGAQIRIVPDGTFTLISCLGCARSADEINHEMEDLLKYGYLLTLTFEKIYVVHACMCMCVCVIWPVHSHIVNGNP